MILHDPVIENWYYSIIRRTSPEWRDRVREKRLTKLSSLLIERFTGKEKNFVKYLIKNYRKVIIGRPSDLEEVVSKAGDYRLSKPREKFRDRLLWAFGYNNFKKHLGKALILKTGIKVCPYCNMQYTLITTNESKHVFEYDHFYPQKKYPYLSVSMYNLVPSCGNCNRIKLDDDEIIPIRFHPYGNESFFKFFSFRIQGKNIIDRYINGDKTINIDKEEKSEITAAEQIQLDAYLTKFSIMGLIERHDDIAEDLIKKAFFYTFEKKYELLDTGDGIIFSSVEEIDRFLVGNYTLIEDHSKRPLAKFSTDIAKQLNLI